FSATPTSVRSGPAQPGADTADVAHDWGIPGLARDARAEAGPPPDVSATDATDATDAAASDASVKDTA
ncbi:CoA transferase, partial [Streptomyces scabiei]|nr:CoA transferase [Streptomyces scabiei]